MTDKELQYERLRIAEGGQPKKLIGIHAKLAEERKAKFLEALEMGADLKCAKAIAGIKVSATYKEWWAEDDEFYWKCKGAMERHVLALIQKCKAEGPTAWKLLKNMARGRFRDEPETLIQGQNVQIVFGIPRPEHKIDGKETKKIVEGEAAVGND